MAEGFIDQVGDSLALLRWPELNFLPVPEDAACRGCCCSNFICARAREWEGNCDCRESVRNR